MLIFQVLDLWKSAIYHTIKLPFDAEVAEKFLHVIYYSIHPQCFAMPPWASLQDALHTCRVSSWKFYYICYGQKI